MAFRDGGVHFGEARARTRSVWQRCRKIDIVLAREFHELPRLHETQEDAAILGAERAADGCLLLHEVIPQIFIIRDQFEVRRQTKVMTVCREKLHAEAVNRSKERTVECLDHFERQTRFQNSLPRSLLHFISGAIGVSDDN